MTLVRITVAMHRRVARPREKAYKHLEWNP